MERVCEPHNASQEGDKSDHEGRSSLEAFLIASSIVLQDAVSVLFFLVPPLTILFVHALGGVVPVPTIHPVVKVNLLGKSVRACQQGGGENDLSHGLSPEAARISNPHQEM
jgi:hypothetical protein